ncbi:leucine-rich repeat protein [Plasmodium vivax]|uniref:Leucine-rich repeat protein n=1 Tax=Plasmodium vivax TaxID=5855 RepID=A0A1G4HFQ5_PLAVI|nr:leucine-rich repeat protein [Plasmodium vivax]
MLLDLSNCHLRSLEDSDVILEKLIEQNADYTSVTYLDASNNSIRSLKGLSSFENLKTLNISNNCLTSLDGDFIPPSTEKIIAHHNDLTDICFKGVKKLPGVKNPSGGTQQKEVQSDSHHGGETKEEGRPKCGAPPSSAVSCQEEKGEDSPNSSYGDSYRSHVMNEKIFYTNGDLPLNRLAFLDVSFNKIKKLTTFERYLHIINKKNRERSLEGGYSDEGHIKEFISNKTEQDVMLLFFNSLDTLYLRGNKLTNLKGLSVFKNLKVLDLRSNLINHPVQLFYLLDNKNWLKRYNEEHSTGSFSPGCRLTDCRSYFLSVLQKYRNLKCLQNLFLRGNQHVLRPKHLFLSVCDVLRCANARGRFTTDVAGGEAGEEEDAVGEEADAVGEEADAVGEEPYEVGEEPYEVGDDALDAEGEEDLVSNLLSAASNRAVSQTGEGGYSDGGDLDGGDLDEGDLDEGDSHGGDSDGGYSDGGYSNGGYSDEAYLDESLTDRGKEPSEQVQNLRKAVVPSLEASLSASLVANEAGESNPPVRHQIRGERNAPEKASEPNGLAKRRGPPNGAGELEETSAYRYLREERDDVHEDAAPSEEAPEDAIPSEELIEKLINRISRKVSTNTPKLVTPISGRTKDNVKERRFRGEEPPVMEISHRGSINGGGKTQGVRVSSVEGESGSTYEGVVRQEGLGDSSCDGGEADELEADELDADELDAERPAAPPNGLLHVARARSAVNVEEDETSCSFSSVVKANQAKSVLKEILIGSKGLDRYSSHNSSSMGSDVFEGDSDGASTAGEDPARGDTTRGKPTQGGTTQGEPTQGNNRSGKGVGAGQIRVAPQKGSHADAALTARMREHKRGEGNGGVPPNERFCREGNGGVPPNPGFFRGSQAGKTRGAGEPNDEKIKWLAKKGTLNDEVHVKNAKTAASGNGAKGDCLDGRRKSKGGGNFALVTKGVASRRTNVGDPPGEKGTLKRASERLRTSGEAKEEKQISKEGEKNETKVNDREMREERKKALMGLLKLDLCKGEKGKRRGRVDTSNHPCVYQSKDKKCGDYSASVKSESTDVTERDSRKHVLQGEEKLRLNFPYGNDLGELHRARGISVYAYPVRIQGVTAAGGGSEGGSEEGRTHDKEGSHDEGGSHDEEGNHEESNHQLSNRDELSMPGEESPEGPAPSSSAEILQRLSDLQATSEKDATLSNSLALHLKEVCLTLGKEKQQSDILLGQNEKLEIEIKRLKESKQKLKTKMKKLEDCYKQKCKLVKRYQHMRRRFKVVEQDQVEMPDDDMDHQNKYIENAMEQLYNVFSDVFGENHVMTKRIESLANVYIKKEKSVEIQMVTQRKQLELLKNVEEIVKKKNEYYCELQKKNEIIASLNSNLAKITQSVADMKNGVLESEQKMKDLTAQLAKKEALLKEFERKNSQMMDEKEKLFQKERAQLLDLLNGKDENVKSVKHYKEEIKCLEDKLKNYLDRNVHRMHDKNYELMVDKLHDEQIKMHSLLTEKEKIINEKNIQIENLESQLQSWADEATNWVVVADKHTKLITNHNILKKNYEELKYKYIMDMKYVQTNKNEKVKELMRKYA